MIKETYTCAECGKTEERTTPIEEMEKELRDTFGSQFTPEDCEIVCDDCWKQIITWINS